MNKTSHDSEIKAKGQQVFTACALIHRLNKGVHEIFVPKRAATKKFLPNVFELPGGHIDFGENIVEGLKREIHEEFGLEIKVGDPFSVFDYLNPVKESHSLEIIYFAKLTNPSQKISLNPEDHSEYLWISEEEIEKIHTPDKGPEDSEMKAIRKGFYLLKGGALRFTES